MRLAARLGLSEELARYRAEFAAVGRAMCRAPAKPS